MSSETFKRVGSIVTSFYFLRLQSRAGTLWDELNQAIEDKQKLGDCLIICIFCFGKLFVSIELE